MIICVDFDGTCVTHEFPEVGKDIGAVPILKKLTEQGHQLILFTMRSDNRPDGSNPLSDAVNWFKKHNTPLYGINTNPTQKQWTGSPKAYGELYIDDAALGCPLKYEGRISNRPFVDWREVESLLKAYGILE
jgi:hypothetical protein